MELKSSSQSKFISLPECASDPEEQEVSDDDNDDDRNHKHRRREIGSQSLETDRPEQCLSRSYRKFAKPLENGQSHYNLDREIPSKFGKRQLSTSNFTRFPSEGNQRYNMNQSFSGRGRVRDSSSWNKHDPRFPALDIASRIAPTPIPPAIFASRGLHSVSNAFGGSWAGGFGLIPGMPNGPIDPIHPLGLQGSFRSPLNPSLYMGIPRQRCRDFEERGFCLRGDMCPLEHGLNHIVVEDVQSLSQFNLPVSLPSAHILGNPAGSRLGASVNASSSAMINGKGVSSRASKSGIDVDSYTSGGALYGMADASGADVYDPDQPLWNTDFSQASNGRHALQTPVISQNEPFMEADSSDQLVRSNGAAVGESLSSSVWGRMNTTKNRSELEEKTVSKVYSPEFLKSTTNDKHEMHANAHGKQSSTSLISSSNPQNDPVRYTKKPIQKALRTLFVNCIPVKDNKKETLVSHFRRFGEVIDIYIPSNSERAFVQFSKREEAERALKSPDAVMGNRFIKLLWANRDSFVDEGTAGGNNMPGRHHHMPEAFVSSLLTVVNTRKDLQPCVPKAGLHDASGGPRTINCDAKPLPATGPKVPTAPPVQNKFENLEVLKEELRKKQEMLEQKRNEFRRQLDKLQRHANGVKEEAPEVQAAKRLKVEGSYVLPKSGAPEQVNLQAVCADFLAEGSPQVSQPVENMTFYSSTTKYSASVVELPNSKSDTRPHIHVGSQFPLNRYKLDNRSTTFSVNAPLPNEFGNLDAIGDHFAVYGDLSSVELEHSEVLGRSDDNNGSETADNLSARVSFKTRQAAERAFINGKTWNGCSLHLTWVMPTKSASIRTENFPASGRPWHTETKEALLQKPSTTNSGERGSSVSTTKEASSAESQSMEKTNCDASRDRCGSGQDLVPYFSSFTGAEAQSANKSVVSLPQEASRPDSTDSEVVEQESGSHQLRDLDENNNSN